MAQLVDEVRNILPLEWSEQDGQIVVTTRDGDRFIIKLNRAIEILRVADKDQFPKQFHLLSRVLAEWIRDHSGIRAAYLTVRDGALAFIVVRDMCEYDEDFEDALSALDLAVANDPDLNLIKLNTVALPAASQDAVSSFLDPEFLFIYQHADRSGPHRSGE